MRAAQAPHDVSLVPQATMDANKTTTKKEPLRVHLSPARQAQLETLADFFGTPAAEQAREAIHLGMHQLQEQMNRSLVGRKLRLKYGESVSDAEVSAMLERES